VLTLASGRSGGNGALLLTIYIILRVGSVALMYIAPPATRPIMSLINRAVSVADMAIGVVRYSKYVK